MFYILKIYKEIIYIYIYIYIYIFFNNAVQGTSLEFKWLRLHTPKAGDLCLISGQGTGSHMPLLKISLATVKILCAATKKT